MEKKIIEKSGLREKIINGKKCSVYIVDKISELFKTGIPEIDDLPESQALFDLFDNGGLKKEPSTKCVYAIKFTDGIVKIGISNNPLKRIRVIEKQSGRTIDDYFISKIMPTADALEIESSIKKEHKSKNLNGEFFNIDYQKVLATIK